MRKFGTNRKTVAVAAGGGFVDIITIAENAIGVVVRTISSERVGGADNLSFTLQAYDGVNGYRIEVHPGAYATGIDEIRLPPGWALRASSLNAASSVGVTWDDL